MSDKLPTASVATIKPSTTPPFVFPYSNDEATNQIVFQVSKADHGLIKCVRPLQGTIRIVGATLWKKFCDLCRKQGIIDMTSENSFELLLTEVVLIPKKEYEDLQMQAVAQNGRPVPAPASTPSPASKRASKQPTHLHD